MTDFEEFLQTPHGRIILDNLELTAKLIRENTKNPETLTEWTYLFHKMINLYITPKDAA